MIIIWVLLAAFAIATGMLIFLKTRASPAAPGTPPSGSSRLRHVLLGGLIGALPGILVVVVPLVLHEAGAISADASQIGFLGVFLVPVGLVVGIVVGTMTGAPGGDSESSKVGPRS